MVVEFGVALKAPNAAVTPSSDFHVSHAVFLPRPPKHDTVSHPVKAWKKGKAWHLFGPSVLAISCAAKNLKNGEGNPQFVYVEALGCHHCKYNNVSVNSMD